MEGVKRADEYYYGDDVISDIDDDNRDDSKYVVDTEDGDSDDEEFGETETKKSRPGGVGTKREKACKGKVKGR